MEGDAPRDASSEYRVHRAIDKKCPCSAIVHAHPPFAVAASLPLDEVIPKDSDDGKFCQVILVVKGRPGTDELAEHVALNLAVALVVIARGHGTFAAGKSLDESSMDTSLAENSCRILILDDCLNKKNCRD